MARTTKLIMLLPLAAAIVLAGPPGSSHSSGAGAGAGGRSFSSGHFGSPAHYGAPSGISGPPPLGASGPAPTHASGSFLPAYGPGRGAGHVGGPNRGYGGGNNNTGNGHKGNGDYGRHRYPYGFYPVPYVLPYYGSGYDSAYYDSPDYSSEPGPGPGPEDSDAQALMMNQDALGQRVQQLTAEVENLKSQQQPQPSPDTGAAVKPADSDIQNEVPVTLILHSGQQIDVKNYAVTDGVFWNFSKQPAQKIPVSAIDITASEKATEAKGGEFPPISQPTP
jgi:hypothetical protein